MVELDHLTVIAPTLEEGVAHVRACLGVDIPPGGRHPLMGTHNHLMRLGDDVFLEVIAIDPDAPPPPHPRWFGLDERLAVQARWEAGHRLSGWVARTRNLDALLAEHAALLGRKTRLTRGDLSWDFAVPPDGSLPMNGAVPSVMDWGAGGTPAPRMADLGARLMSFELHHPEAERLRKVYADLGVQNGPKIVDGGAMCYRAEIQMPTGLCVLA